MKFYYMYAKIHLYTRINFNNLKLNLPFLLLFTLSLHLVAPIKSSCVMVSFHRNFDRPLLVLPLGTQSLFSLNMVNVLIPYDLLIYYPIFFSNSTASDHRYGRGVTSCLSFSGPGFKSGFPQL